MANLSNLIMMVQGRVHDQSTGYRKTIEVTAETIWAYVAGIYDLSFLRAPAPLKITLAADASTVETDENVGRMLYISDSRHGPKIMTYLPWRQFEKTIVDDDSGESGYFSDHGVKNNKKVLVVNVPAATSTDYYLHYNEKGTLANISKAPEEMNLALFHGIMSVLAPPDRKKFRADPSYLSWWKAVTHKEDKQFIDHLGRLVRQGIIAGPDEPAMEMDGLNADRLSELGELS